MYLAGVVLNPFVRIFGFTPPWYSRNRQFATMSGPTLKCLNSQPYLRKPEAVRWLITDTAAQWVLYMLNLIGAFEKTFVFNLVGLQMLCIEILRTKDNMFNGYFFSLLMKKGCMYHKHSEPILYDGIILIWKDMRKKCIFFLGVGNVVIITNTVFLLTNYLLFKPPIMVTNPDFIIPENTITKLKSIFLLNSNHDFTMVIKKQSVF